MWPLCSPSAPSAKPATKRAAELGSAPKSPRRRGFRGVSFLDTADAYGPYANEERVGRAIRGRRAEVFLATKFGIERDAANPTRRRINGRPDYVRQACDASLRLLRAVEGFGSMATRKRLAAWLHA